MTTRTQQLSSVIMIAVFASNVQADVIGFTDFEEWEQAVGSYSTIDFTGWPEFTIITEQYSHLGVTFTDMNDFIRHTTSFVNDGEGLHGSWTDKQITVVFDSPQLWIGIDHPGSAAFNMYFQGELINSTEFWQGGWGNFSGVVADQYFDKVIIYRPTGNAPLIDDLHWGVPAPGAVGVFALALLCGGSRRRRR